MSVDTSAEAVERLLEGVTPGPWRRGADENPRVYAPDGMGNLSSLVCSTSAIRIFVRQRDAAFIAASRELVPALAAERDALAARVAELEAAADQAEVVGGLTHDGSLWRYWRKLSRGYLNGKIEAEARVAELEGALRSVLAVVDGVPMTGPESERRADAARAALPIPPAPKGDDA